MTEPSMTRQDAFAYLLTMEEGRFLVADIESRRADMMRMMNNADDCTLRKLAGACGVLQDLLDDFAEAQEVLAARQP